MAFCFKPPTKVVFREPLLASQVRDYDSVLGPSINMILLIRRRGRTQEKMSGTGMLIKCKMFIKISYFIALRVFICIRHIHWATLFVHLTGNIELTIQYVVQINNSLHFSWYFGGGEGGRVDPAFIPVKKWSSRNFITVTSPCSLQSSETNKSYDKLK